MPSVAGCTCVFLVALHIGGTRESVVLGALLWLPITLDLSVHLAPKNGTGPSHWQPHAGVNIWRDIRSFSCLSLSTYQVLTQLCPRASCPARPPGAGWLSSLGVSDQEGLNGGARSWVRACRWGGEGSPAPEKPSRWRRGVPGFGVFVPGEGEGRLTFLGPRVLDRLEGLGATTSCLGTC